MQQVERKDINQCSLEDMYQVVKGEVGLGETLCRTIVKERSTEKGAFKSWDDLKERVSGLNGVKLQKLQKVFDIEPMSSGATVTQPVSPLL